MRRMRLSRRWGSRQQIEKLATIVRAAALYGSDRKTQAVELLRSTAGAARQRVDAKIEEKALGTLLDMTANERLPDADALRARLDELNASKPAPT